MNIYILNKISNEIGGGGNHFLRALRDEFIKSNIYVDSPIKADIILFDSYQVLLKVFFLKFKYPNKKYIYRLGPVFQTYRTKQWKIIDNLMVYVANKIADGVIFQSNWSKKKFLEMGFKQENNNCTIIHNAVDNNIFSLQKNKINYTKKIKLITDSNSSNWNKGFVFYNFLDKKLNFNKYEFILIGGTPINFVNINYLGYLNSANLSRKLKESDIFISGVKDDACSNSIIEALSCGLPVIGLDSGANKELIGEGGVLFKNENELLYKIDEVASKIDFYRKKIKVKTIEEISDKYSKFIKKIKKVKKISFISLLFFLLIFFIFKCYNRIANFYQGSYDKRTHK